MSLRGITGGSARQVVQVPLTFRNSRGAGLDHALLGRVDDGGGHRWVYDGTHDPAFVSAWLRLLLGNKVTIGDGGSSARGVRHTGDHGVSRDGPSRVLRGEQSNTSIIVDGTNGAGSIIIKLFRVLQAGENPDAVVATALASTGCQRIPRRVGWVEGSWPDPEGSHVVHGHLAYACEFIEGSQDAWRSARRAAATGTSFAAEAAALGTTTAEVHAALAAALPSVPASPSDLRALADSLDARLRLAAAVAPTIGDLRRMVEALFHELRTLAPHPAAAPVLQRIHGDYHLGQVLHSPSRGWVLFDFEGEPLRPLAERSRPDLALRDVAGMLRSFDYAAHYETHALPAGDRAVSVADEWARECRAAFLGAYRDAAGATDAAHDEWEHLLLRTFEVDKALYEVVYETWNRPDWVGIPLHALRRLLRT